MRKEDRLEFVGGQVREEVDSNMVSSLRERMRKEDGGICRGTGKRRGG